MSLINSTAIPSGVATGYEIGQSLRFNNPDNAYLSRTFVTPTNRKIWTFSVWLKRSVFGAYPRIFSTATGAGGNTDNINFMNDDTLRFISDFGGLTTTMKFRDPSSWYHIVYAFDSTQSTEANRLKLYVNGTQVTSFSSTAYPTLNDEVDFNSAIVHDIGRNAPEANQNMDGYLGEINWIDGQAKAPTDLGEFGDYGEWKPIEYSGTYGNNGFYLPFKQDYTVEGFSTVTYRGTGSSHYIGGVGFSPDLVWVKKRSAAGNHKLHDQVRGPNKYLDSNTTSVEGSGGTQYLTAFSADGFTVGTEGVMNANAATFVAWNWDMGGSNATNTAGSIDSTVRANASYGQSIVSYTGDGGTATVGHGLSSAPEMIILKTRDTDQFWVVYHANNTANPETDYLRLNGTNATTDDTYWDDTAPTNALFSLRSGAAVNKLNDKFIAYCFHSVTGYSKIGSYTGNGSTTGPSVTLGFAPAFLLIKSSTQGEPWSLIDNMRTHTTAGLENVLTANTSAAETQYYVDLNSNGFQIKDTTGVLNANSQTYIYMAFADKREYAYWLDQSGNNNDWTSNNLTDSDVMVDSPTNNFATMNPLFRGAPNTGDVDSAHTLTEGNLKMRASANKMLCPTLIPTSGKCYAEFYVNAKSTYGPSFGWVSNDYTQTNLSTNTGLWRLYSRGASDQLILYPEAASSVTIESAALHNGDIIQFAWDCASGKAWIGRNNTWYNSSLGTTGNPSTGANPTITTTVAKITNNFIPFIASADDNSTMTLNFGQDSSFASAATAQGNQDGNDIGDFYYAPPTGFLALCTKNLPDVAVIPSEQFNSVLYTGTDATNSTHAISGIGFQPDFVWTKDRDATYDHYLFDSVRGTGVTKGLSSSSSRVEGMANESYDALSSFDSDGFTITGAAFGSLYQDRGSADYVSWNWKAGNATLGTGAFTQGSSASTCSRNADAGFSIVSYTGTGSTATVGHGLSNPPEMMIIRSRDVLDNWLVFANTGSMDATDGLYLDSTTAKLDSDTFFNDTAPTNSLFTVKSHSTCNTNTKPYIAYCFHSVEGYSKVGSYKGNANADGAFVYTGFRPAYILIKNIDSAEPWVIQDTARSPFNPRDDVLFANTTDAEVDWASYPLDILSNGFKPRNTGSSTNSAHTFIYLAFAETPFKYSNAR